MRLDEFRPIITDLSKCIPKYSPQFDSDTVFAWYNSFRKIPLEAFRHACSKAKETEKSFPSIAQLISLVGTQRDDTHFYKAPMPTFTDRWHEIRKKHGTDLNEFGLSGEDRNEGVFRLNSRPWIRFRYMYESPLESQVPYEFTDNVPERTYNGPSVRDIARRQSVADQIVRDASSAVKGTGSSAEFDY